MSGPRHEVPAEGVGELIQRIVGNCGGFVPKGEGLRLCVEALEAALRAPEAPVRGEIRVINGKRCRFIERELEGDKWEVIGPALTPRHEAPASVPADVARLVIAARRVAFDNPTQAELRALDIASEAFADRVPWEDEPESHEAPAEGELLPCPFCGEAVSIRKGVNGYGHCKTDGCHANRAQIVSLDDEKQVAAWNRRARSSAPEAREDAQPFAWAYRLNFPDENTAWDWQAEKEKMTEAKFGQHGGILETMPLYTHPAAPSADKLRIAVEALEFYSFEDNYSGEPEDRFFVGSDDSAFTEMGLSPVQADEGKRARQALDALKGDAKP